MDSFRPISKNIGFFNARYKFYPTPDGERRAVEATVFSEPVYNPNHLERMDSNAKHFVKEPVQMRLEFDEAAAPVLEDGQTEEHANKCSDYAIRRARKRVFDLVACNPDCNMFVTLTLNGADFPRDDWNGIARKLSTWLDNMTRRRGLKYILVPEFHKDGESIHFHGFMNESALSLVRAKNPHTGKPIKHKGRAVYNVANWKFGFTTAVRVGKSDVDQTSSAKYVLKYITKNSEKIGGRYYLHGGNLKEPTYEYLNVDFEKVEGEAWSEFPVTEKLVCKLCRYPRPTK